MTSTTFVTALVCFYLQIPVGHVEVGLRTHNIYSPYPEEFNRQAVSIVSQFNLAPTKMAADEELGGCDRIHIIEPIEVFDCHNFESRCHNNIELAEFLNGNYKETR
jgi:hypothetical protein